MVLTPSHMVALGTPCPEFCLPDTEGQLHTRGEYLDKPLLVVFMCNHCPYVIHIAPTLAKVALQCQNAGVQVIGINSNDVNNYPDDSPENMVKEVAARGYTFPYLFDETQDVAKAFHATCTPDFFLYTAKHELAYRGQFDETRPGAGTATGNSLWNAVQALLQGNGPSEQHPSVGCNIKWR